MDRAVEAEPSGGEEPADGHRRQGSQGRESDRKIQVLCPSCPEGRLHVDGECRHLGEDPRVDQRRSDPIHGGAAAPLGQPKDGELIARHRADLDEPVLNGSPHANVHVDLLVGEEEATLSRRSDTLSTGPGFGS